MNVVKREREYMKNQKIDMKIENFQFLTLRGLLQNTC